MRQKEVCQEVKKLNTRRESEYQQMLKGPQSLSTATRWTSRGQKGALEIKVPTLWLRILVTQWIVQSPGVPTPARGSLVGSPVGSLWLSQRIKINK